MEFKGTTEPQARYFVGKRMKSHTDGSAMYTEVDAGADVSGSKNNGDNRYDHHGNNSKPVKGRKRIKLESSVADAA